MKRTLLILTVLLGVSKLGSAQAFDTSPNAQTGRQSFGSSFDGNIDSVNLYSGNLFLEIKLFTRSGRELSTGLEVTYNSQKWQQFHCVVFNCGVYTGGWKINDPIGEAPGFSSADAVYCPDPNPN